MKKIIDDVWYEIFLHLPLGAIFKFQCVSKVWCSTLSSPNFLAKWYKLNNLSLPWIFSYAVSSHENTQECPLRFSRMFTIAYHNLHSQLIENHQIGFSLNFLDPIFPENDSVFKIALWAISSSNGLVLCQASLIDQGVRDFYVCNPLTKKWVLLPPPPPPMFLNDNAVSGFVESCSSSLSSAGYKVICIPRFKAAAKEFKVGIFSSDSGHWTIYDVSCAPGVTWEVSLDDNFTSHNGVFFWFQKVTGNILAVSVNECRLINLPEPAMGDDLRNRLGESEGSICYAILKEREKSLSVWVLEEDWCLLCKDTEFQDILAEMETMITGGVGTIDLITQIQVVGFNPFDKNVVILGYKKYIWAINVRTKGYEQLSHPSFLDNEVCTHHPYVSAFAIKPRPTILPPISW